MNRNNSGGTVPLNQPAECLETCHVFLQYKTATGQCCQDAKLLLWTWNAVRFKNELILSTYVCIIEIATRMLVSEWYCQDFMSLCVFTVILKGCCDVSSATVQHGFAQKKLQKKPADEGEMCAIHRRWDTIEHLHEEKVKNMFAGRTRSDECSYRREGECEKYYFCWKINMSKMLLCCRIVDL